MRYASSVQLQTKHRLRQTNMIALAAGRRILHR
uniref:Uncharacterized protein n=1 Tax=Arundo donax TaxID=35708 RepID=A0A0A9BSI0_ARUDO